MKLGDTEGKVGNKGSRVEGKLESKLTTNPIKILATKNPVTVSSSIQKTAFRYII